MQVININDINYMKFCNIIDEKKKKEKDGNKEKKEEKKIPEKENIITDKEENKMVRNFRSYFQLSKEDYNDDYVEELLLKGKNDFQKAFTFHLDKEDEKKERNKKMTQDDKSLDMLVQEFRKYYNLPDDTYPDDKIKNILKEKEGDFSHTFEELMKFIE